MVATKSDRTKSRDKEPLDVELTLSFRFGDEADDKITMIDNRRIPMVGSVFEKRDLLIRNFVKLMVKAGVSQLSSSVGAEMPTVAAATAAFSLLTLFLGMAFWSLIRRPKGQLAIQSVAFVVSALACMYLYNLFTV